MFQIHQAAGDHYQWYVSELDGRTALRQRLVGHRAFGPQSGATAGLVECSRNRGLCPLRQRRMRRGKGATETQRTNYAERCNCLANTVKQSGSSTRPYGPKRTGGYLSVVSMKA